MTAYTISERWNLNFLLPYELWGMLSHDVMAFGDANLCCNAQRCMCLDTEFRLYSSLVLLYE